MAHLKGQTEFFQIFAQPVGIIGRVALFSGKRKEFFPRFGTALALYVGRDQKDPGLFEKIEVHFPVSTVLVKWYLPEKFIPQYYFYAGCRVIVSTIIWKKETVSTVSDGYFIILKL